VQGKIALCESVVYDMMTSLNTKIKSIYTKALIRLGCVGTLWKKDKMLLYNYKVTQIKKTIDGDTIDVVIDMGFNISKSTRVRLLGIDAPETRTKDKKQKQKGLESREFLSALLDGCVKHNEVVLVSTKLDAFGRSLGHVYIDGENLSEIMIKNGHASSR